jgi:hypothetical protein
LADTGPHEGEHQLRRHDQQCAGDESVLVQGRSIRTKTVVV